MTTEYIIIINLEELWLLIYILYAYVYIIYGLGWFIIYIPAESYRSGDIVEGCLGNLDGYIDTEEYKTVATAAP